MAWREWSSHRMEWCLRLLIVTIACRIAAAQECPLLIPSFREAQSEVSIPSALYLYTTPFDSQCTESISEVEFCYRRGSAADRLFTVVILRQMGNEAFRVVARSDVSADPNMDSCTVDPHIATVERCCTTRRLEPVIDITEGNVYAIETAVTASILLNFAKTSRPGTVISVPAGVSYDVGSTVSSGLLSNVSVEMVRFIAIDGETATSPPVTSSPPIVMPPPPQPTPTLFPTTQGPTSTRTPPQSSTAPPTEQDSDFDPVRVGMGVALGFLVAITVVIIAVTVAVMVVKRRRKRDAACGVQPSWGDGFTNAFYTAANTSADDITAIPNEAYAITTIQNVACRSLQPDDRTVQETPASDADGYDYVREQAVVIYE